MNPISVADKILFEIPPIDYSAIAPILIVLVAAVVSVLAEAFLPKRARRPVQLVLVFGALIAAFVDVLIISGTRIITASGSISIDGPALVMQGAILILSALGAMLMAERLVHLLGLQITLRLCRWIMHGVIISRIWRI